MGLHHVKEDWFHDLFIEEAKPALDNKNNGGGSGSASVEEKDVNFRDYDGTVLYSYTVEEAAALTELPPLPTRTGLICQGWNWSLASIQSHARAIEVGATYITDDGTTRIYITLQEGRTSPMLGCCPNGTVTVDWGDGTTPDTLTGTSTLTVRWTPNHQYAEPGDYVIKLTVDGAMSFYGSNNTEQLSGILRYSSDSDGLNTTYRHGVRSVEIGSGVTTLLSDAFTGCYNLTSVVIPNNVTEMRSECFSECNNLVYMVIPRSLTKIVSEAFYQCDNLRGVSIPDTTRSIESKAFSYCYNLGSIVMPDGVTTLGAYAFQHCRNLASVTIPNGINNIQPSVFSSARNIVSVKIPSEVRSIGDSAFGYMRSLTSVTALGNISTIDRNSFYNSSGVCYYDFTKNTAVPTLSSTNAFGNIADDCEIRVPAALYDEWIVAPNWSNSSIVNHIVPVGEKITVNFYDETGENIIHTVTDWAGSDIVYDGTEPTKESTAQYTYTFAGWSLTPGGEVDADALTAVAADCNVYAVFTETLRTYTVYWYNGDTLLETDSAVAYGSVPTYDGADPVYSGDDAENYEWTGWSPVVEAITGDTTYTAEFEYTAYVYRSILDKSISGKYVNNDVTTIGNYVFMDCWYLTSVEFPQVTTVGPYAFKDCSKITSVSFPQLTAVPQSMFYNNSSLTSLSLPMVTTIGRDAFGDCETLAYVDLPMVTTIGTRAFNPCRALNTLILRSETMVTIESNSLSNSSISSGTGYIYVPAALVDSYKADANWSDYASQIRAIEDYPEITGGES